MAEEIPRRMQRYYRKKPSEEEVREKSSELAIQGVDSFRNQNSRYPNRDELEEISQNVFEQLKRELDSQNRTEKDNAREKEGKEDSKENESGKSLLEKRK